MFEIDFSYCQLSRNAIILVLTIGSRVGIYKNSYREKRITDVK